MKTINKRESFDFTYTFPPLGHPEHHFNKYPKHPWLKEKESVSKWVSDNILIIDTRVVPTTTMKNKGFVIHDDLTVSFDEAYIYTIEDNKLEYMPVQIRELYELNISKANEIRSLVGFPYKVDVLTVMDAKIKNWEGLSLNVNYINLNDNLIESFKGMPSFRNKVVVSVYGNPINGWEYLDRNVSQLYFWNKKAKVSDYKTILESPEHLNMIALADNYGFNEIKQDGDGCVDMYWLFNEKEKIKKINKVNKNIDGNLIDDCVKEKKRKI